MKKPLIFSIIVLVYNEEYYLPILLKRLILYTKNYSTEIIFVDSGSSDKSVELIKEYQKKYKMIRLYLIKKESFHFAKTRNWVIKKARSQYVLFLSADALPFSDNIFEYFIEDFKLSKKVVAVFGQHIPYSDTPLLQKIEAQIKFDILNRYINKKGLLIFNRQKPFLSYNQANYYYWWLLSNTFCCYKKEYLKKNPFPNINGYEDMFLGKIIVNSGLFKIYDSRCKVLHSHSLNLSQYFNKQLEEFKAVNKNFKIRKPSNIKFKVAKIFKENFNTLEKISFLIKLFCYYFIKLIALLISRLPITRPL